MTKVVNVYKARYDVYIGRAGKGNDGYFGNPFAMKNESERDAVLKKYEAYFLDRIEKDAEFKNRILALKGKTLGCFCAPRACHGHVIAAWLDNK